eukprot:CAMPEP_0197061040 /NCGR_PEP_ID=MMETSP1384-20130603/132982_1 /TAXON_ID=29189 /ORGANISM="Ammonia sp." /LENGTH=41 /DNA_ID= /DNA_START= /DNA_END= /DNA_ORIENTATION=
MITFRIYVETQIMHMSFSTNAKMYPKYNVDRNVKLAKYTMY